MDSITGLVPGREEQDWNSDPLLSKAPTKLKAVEVGQQDIKDHQVKLGYRLEELAQGQPAVLLLVDSEPGQAQ
jgi:hypothetical protein